MKKSISIFGQILQIVDKNDFWGLAKKTGSNRYVKTFTSWDHFSAMMFCQLGNAHSLREIEVGLASIEKKVKHLGMETAPARSTLSHANANRPPELFEGVFYGMLDRCRQAFAAKQARRKFRFKKKLYSFDASVIDLCLSMFDWAKFRKTKGAVKLHLLLDHDGYLPTFATLTEGKTHEVKIARTLDLPKGAIVAIDRAFNDYALYEKWSENGVSFVTRLKENANLDSIEQLPIKGEHVLGDELVKFHDEDSFDKCPRVLRKVTIYDPKKEMEFVFLTNDLKLAARTIGDIYKDRWQIEAFFKNIKQNLRIKTFVGTSRNAVMIQVWTALIAILMLKFMAFKAEAGWSLSNLVAVLRFNIVSYIDLWGLLNQEFKFAMAKMASRQLELWPA